MNKINAELAEAAVLARAGWISQVLVAGVILSATVCFLRYRRQEEFEVLKVKFPLRLFPLFCAGYTLAHGYLTWLFVDICTKVHPMPALWSGLTLKGPIVFNGMLPRDKLLEIPLWSGLRIPITHISVWDPTLWLFYSFCIVVYFGFTWSCELGGYSRLRTRFLAILLLASNWILGGLWANAASLLTK